MENTIKVRVIKNVYNTEFTKELMGSIIEVIDNDDTVMDSYNRLYRIVSIISNNISSKYINTKILKINCEPILKEVIDKI